MLLLEYEIDGVLFWNYRTSRRLNNIRGVPTLVSPVRRDDSRPSESYLLAAYGIAPLRMRLSRLIRILISYMD